MSNGRTYDPEIADCLIQAATDGEYSYRAMVEIVHAQASIRHRETLEAGGTDEEAEAEYCRWAGFTISSITKWKTEKPEFEAELAEASNQGAVVEAHRTIGPLIVEFREVGFDEDLPIAERHVRLKALSHIMNAHRHLVTIRLERRRQYHASTSSGGGFVLPEMPRNSRYDGPASGDVN